MLRAPVRGVRSRRRRRASQRWSGALRARARRAELRAEELHLGRALARVLARPGRREAGRLASTARRHASRRSFALAAAALGHAARTPRCSATPARWLENQVARAASSWCRSARSPASACCSQLAPTHSRGRATRARARRRRASAASLPGARARERAARNPVHAAISIVTRKPMIIERMTRNLCASASAARSAPARPRSSTALCKRLRDRYRHRGRDQRHLHPRGRRVPHPQRGACRAERIVGVETGGCPHTAIREDASINLEAVDELVTRFPDARSDHRRERRRQPGRHLQPRARRPDASTSSTSPPATRSRARAARASRRATCSSSTRSTSRRTWAPRSR